MPMITQKKYRLAVWILVIATFLYAIGWAAYRDWLIRTHTVISHEVYRSAQLSPHRLHHYIETRQIKSIINLRGMQDHSAWYLKEVAMSTSMGVKHYDLALPSHRIPSVAELRALVYLLMQAPKPTLLHCLGGADRTGFASAVAMILTDHSLSQSEQQVSIKHLVLSPHSIGLMVFPYYKTWLNENHLSHSRDNFLAWVCSPAPFGKDAPETAPSNRDLNALNLCPVSLH